jgi:disulfide oxidoreductase YuzD
MTSPIVVQIVGAPTACAEGIKDGWRETAHWAAGQLKARFGDSVRVDYFDLFDPNCPSIPPNTQLPLVLVAGQVISSGGKLPLLLIRKAVEQLLLE